MPLLFSYIVDTFVSKQKAMIKKVIFGVVAMLLIALSVTTFLFYSKYREAENNWQIAEGNVKAYATLNSELKEKNQVFQFTVEQLDYLNDSLILRMNNLRKELKIKDEDLAQMQYMLSEASKKDTIRFVDTIFVNPHIAIDTLIGDRWHTLKLSLRYPNEISTESTFISEKYAFINSRKETIKPPKKFFLARLFQRKHIVTEVRVVEKNPYIENKEQMFIKVEKKF